jgi:hypothetical protein
MPVRSAVGPLLLVVLVGCSAEVSISGTTLPLADTALDDPDDTTVASVLAPSQTSASTAPPPATPPPCGADDVELWTAATRPGASTVDAVVRMRNVGDSWCEADIGRSPLLDPAIEPDVWLQPGDTADLVVGQAVEPCDDPALVTAVQVGIGDTSVVVPSALVTCGWWLTAFYPNDAVATPCERGDLELVVTAGAVVIGTSSSAPCVIDALTAVDGVPLVAPSSAPQPIEVFPGDVVAVGRPGGAACEGSASRTLRFDNSLEAEIDGVPCGFVFESAPPRPWYGSPSGPAAFLPAGAGLEEILDALDPFGRRS